MRRTSFIPAKPEHIPRIVANMRERDVEELWQGAGLAPDECLIRSLANSSEAFTLLHGLQPMCMCGLVPGSFLGGWSQLWIVGTKFIDEHPFAFARASKQYMPRLLRNCYAGTNFLAADDEMAMRWCKWLGAVILEDALVLREGRWFVQFVVGNKERVCQQA